MKFAYTYDDHHGAGYEWDKRNVKAWVADIFEAPAINIGSRCTADIRAHVKSEFLNQGWALDVCLDSDSMIKVFSLKEDMAFQIQTGNMSRAPYDVLKLEYLYKSGRIETAALALPVQEAAKKMGDNVVNAERMIRELKLFDRVITLPLLIVAFR